MLLVIDVGNTNITLGVFDKEELFGTFRMKTKQPLITTHTSPVTVLSAILMTAQQTSALQSSL